MGSEVIIRGGFKTHFHPASEKKYSPTVIFVHHMWGSHRTTARHYRTLNQLGFDCISFNLLYGSKKQSFVFHPLIFQIFKGVFYIWKEQVRRILDDVPGEKILFGFSGPSLSTLWAASDRDDVKMVICDGGPFEKIYSNSKNLFANVVGIKNPLLNIFLAFIGTLLWGLRPLRELSSVLSRWKTNVPLLSIRGGKDPIVPPETIDAVFRPHPSLNIEIFEIKEGGHLDGLKNFEGLYKKKITEFILKSI